MALLPIITYPNLLLKKKSEEVKAISSLTRKFVKDMFETMYAASGVGLAAVQVAKADRILVIDVGRTKGETFESHPICLINPEIVKAEGQIALEEGCLSCPNLKIEVPRAAIVTVKGLDESGKPLEIEATELLAVAFQHEIDHLNGTLLADRLSRLKRELYRKELAKSTIAPTSSTSKKTIL